MPTDYAAFRPALFQTVDRILAGPTAAALLNVPEQDRPFCAIIGDWSAQVDDGSVRTRRKSKGHDASAHGQLLLSRRLGCHQLAQQHLEPGTVFPSLLAQWVSAHKRWVNLP